MTDTLSETISALGGDEEVQAILREVCALTDMGFAAVAYVSEERWIACQVEDRIEFGLDPGGELEIKKTICDDIRRCGKPILIDDTINDPDWWSHPVPVLYGFKSYVSLPITIDGKFFGTLCAIDPAPRDAPLGERLAALEAMAQRVGALIGARIAASPTLSPAGA